MILKQQSEAIQGNIFMMVVTKLITPQYPEGCLNGVMKQILTYKK
jgi:branched-subunit amino acid aminotransferase/4-amino-4-deoxychorismate lyase